MLIVFLYIKDIRSEHIIVIKYIKSDFFAVITMEHWSVNLFMWYKKTGWIKYTIFEELAMKFRALDHKLVGGLYCIKKANDARMKLVQYISPGKLRWWRV